MPLHYGEYSEDGQDIVKDTAFCILTGKRVGAGDITAGIPGTRYFARVNARRAADVTPAMLAAVKIAIEQERGVAVEPAPVPEKKTRKGGDVVPVESGEG